MVTVVNPGASETTIYNRSGTTIVSVTGGEAGVGQGTSIPRQSEVTCALVTFGAGGLNGVLLPSDAEIGDVVEVYNLSAASPSTVVIVQPDASSSWWASWGGVAIEATFCSVFRKIAATQWAPVSVG